MTTPPEKTTAIQWSETTGKLFKSSDGTLWQQYGYNLGPAVLLKALCGETHVMLDTASRAIEGMTMIDRVTEDDLQDVRSFVRKIIGAGKAMTPREKAACKWLIALVDEITILQAEARERSR